MIKNLISKNHILFLFTSFLVVLTAVIIACKSNSEQKVEQPPKRVETIVLKSTPVTQKLTVSGKIEALDSTMLAFKIGGRIDMIKNDVGDHASKNQVMASLDQDEIKAQVTQAQLNYDKFKRDFERVDQLFKENAATKSQLQDITTGLENAEQQLKIANYNLLHSKIQAPFDGYIAMKRHEEGEMISPGDPVFIFVSDAAELKVISGIAGTYVSKIRNGAKCTVTTPNLGNSRFNGEVFRIGVAADMATGTFPVEIKVFDDKNLLKPGMVVTARIEISTSGEYILVPPQALIEADEDRGYVFIFDPSSKNVKKQPVKIGEIYEDNIIIDSGLNIGDEIVIEGAEYLVSGDQVEKVQAQAGGEK
ncbi:MAG: efflux RND transporter periplasmic adaptor subunit [Acidobacteria bacterium]|nr:efflux RND transporter periplasmic adaptor subunit [Acidobacteriota bacterium]